MKKEKLTALEEKAVNDYREEWLRVGRSTKKADRVQAEKSMSEIYRWLGKKQPIFWWCDSPFQACVIPELLREATQRIRCH